MKTNMTDLQRLAKDVYEGRVANYSVEDGDKAIRNAIVEACGGEWNYYNFKANQYKVFQVWAEVLQVSMGDMVLEQFSRFAEIRNTNLGDTPEFILDDPSLFKIVSIADGNKDVRRQKLYGKKFTVTTERLAVKIYEELDMYLAGRVDFVKMVNRVATSYAYEIALRTYNAIYGAYSSLSAPYKVNGTFDAATLSDMIAHVEAKTGKKVAVFGTKKALSKITYTQWSDSMKDKLNLQGFVGMFNGTDCYELPQGHLANTDTFAVNDSFLLIIPVDSKPVKIMIEGQPYIEEGNGSNRNDMQMEYLFTQKLGVAVIQYNDFAIYQLA